MSQSRWGSAIEAVSNVAIGYAINFVANLVVLPLVGLPVTVRQVLWIGVAFTAIALVRTYCVRRLFEAFRRKAARDPYEEPWS